LVCATPRTAVPPRCAALVLQGLLDTPGGEERVVLKRVKARVQVRERASLAVARRTRSQLV
jgi:hypothetical protein